MRILLCLLLLVQLVAALAAGEPSSSTKPVPTAPWLLSKEERQRQEQLANADRQRLMNLLGVTEASNLPPEETDPKRPTELIRPPNNPHGWTDAAGHFVVRSSWGNWINYDLAKADVGPVPDSLLLKNGQRVTDATMWWKLRRPEIAGDFAREIYGQIPSNTPKITWEIVETNPNAQTGKMRTKTIVGHVDNARFPAASPAILLTLNLPADAKGPVPVMVTIGGFGPPPGFPAPKGPTAMDLVLACGWGYATYNPYAVQSDSGAGLTEGIIGLVNEGRPRQPDEWGALAAWSWDLVGLSTISKPTPT